LFPGYHRKTQKHLRECGFGGKYSREEDAHALLRNLPHLRPADRLPGNFKYWHDRLIILNEAYQEAEAADIKALWKDRRKPHQWFDSWIAIVGFFLTVLFGMIQAVTGALQVYKSYHSKND
jgi:hypothetical protein